MGDRRKRISSQLLAEPNNSGLDLPVELLELILRKLPFVDIIRCSVVCSSWRSAAQTQTPTQAQIPWLMFQSTRFREEEDEDDCTTRCSLILLKTRFTK